MVSEWLSNDTLRVRIGCDLLFSSPAPTPVLLQVRPADTGTHRITDEQRLFTPETAFRHYRDSAGNTVWRVLAPSGPFQVHYDAIVEVPAKPDPVLPDLLRTPIEVLPDDVIVYTLPSRHVQSDLVIDRAWELFGTYPPGWQQVQAVCDWIHTNIAYAKGSTSITSAIEALDAGIGVCRDFAHLGVLFCRALSLPARYVCGYLPDINVPVDPTPMDFHAWFEVYLDGAWRTFDARHNTPRTGRIVIARGRDAVDCAFSTTFGGTVLSDLVVWAYQVSENVLPKPVLAA